MAICFLAKFIHVCDPDEFVVKRFPHNWIQIEEMPLSIGPYHLIAMLMLLMIVSIAGVALCCTQEAGVELMKIFSQGICFIYRDLVFLLLCTMLLLVAISILVSKTVFAQNLLVRLSRRGKVRSARPIKPCAQLYFVQRQSLEYPLYRITLRAWCVPQEARRVAVRDLSALEDA